MSNQTNFTWNGANYCKSDYQNSCIVFVTDLKCVSHDLQKLKRPLTLFIQHVIYKWTFEADGGCGIENNISNSWPFEHLSCWHNSKEEYKFTQCRQHWSLSEQTSEWVVSGPPGTDALAVTDIAFDICGEGGRWTHKKLQTRHATETDIQRRKTWLLWSMCLLVLQLYHFIFY